MGNYYSGSLCHLYTTIGQASVQERAFLDADPLFLQRIEHCWQTSEIEIFPLENQVYMHNFYLLFLHTIWKYLLRKSTK